MSDCTHNIVKREAAFVDGCCPLCLVEDIKALRQRITELEKEISEVYLRGRRDATPFAG